MIKLKSGVLVDELRVIKPELFIALGYFCRFAEQRNLPIVITNILGDFGATRTHSDGRALDISVNEWNMNDVAECLCFLRTNCGYLGAISASTNQPAIMIYHKVEGGAYHFHMQVKGQSNADAAN